MAKPVLISGVQPTGRLHIGNYLGALKNFVELQDSGKYQCYFFIADLHSLTEEFDQKEKQRQILELTADFLAVGLDPKKSAIFQQSRISAHSELASILYPITPMGELERMTQYKDKIANQKENINAGLFNYPVLMAADILMYGTQFVPVGDDQDQHLELARTLARKFNSRFGKTFVEPKGLHTPTPRVMSLKNPTKKMSKSQPEGCLFLDDSPEDISAKLKSAVTDSGSEIKYDSDKKPAIANLLEMYAGITGDEMSKLEKKFKNSSYSDFKNSLAELVASRFADFRKKKKSLMADPVSLTVILKSGSERANKVAEKKIKEVKEKIGLI
ncbi:MAG: tryptophan--tRNA ligase [Candidatus Liptonbacteria bacterium]|nr:tryptophan--tRNA ligase [Candidatus Liptonbacteria bacterium]